jgi:hypothetical protein
LNEWITVGTMVPMDPLAFFIAHSATRRLLDGPQTGDARRRRRSPIRSGRVRT